MFSYKRNQIESNQKNLRLEEFLIVNQGLQSVGVVPNFNLFFRRDVKNWQRNWYHKTQWRSKSVVVDTMHVNKW